jgi:hypothetical protein
MNGTYCTEGDHENSFQNIGPKTLREEATRETFARERGYETVEGT